MKKHKIFLSTLCIYLALSVSWYALSDEIVKRIDKDGRAYFTNTGTPDQGKKYSPAKPKKAIEVSGISTKILRFDSIGNVWVSIKATITNNGYRDWVSVRLQAVDLDGFAIQDQLLQGKIPPGSSIIMTDTSCIGENEFKKIKEWKVAE